MSQSNKQVSLDDVIVKVTNMVSYDSYANILAKNAGYNINYVSWEDCARNKGSVWGPCISDMTLRVNNSCMPVIRKPNYSDTTWDVPMNKVPIVIGNETSNPKENLQTISLTDYLSNFSDFMTNNYYKNTLNKKIDLTSKKENKDSHVIMSSQTCFLPILSGQETKFNVALFNYQSQVKNPAVLVIVSTAKGTSAQIIEGKEQYLLFNNNGKKADFIGERVSDVRKNKGQKQDIYDKKLSMEEKQDNVIVIVQVPLKQKRILKPRGGYGLLKNMSKNMAMAPQMQMDSCLEEKEMDDEAVNVEAAMVKISERTKPVCICNKELQKYQVQYAYSGSGGVVCDICGTHVNGKEDIIYHCVDAKSFHHSDGYDLCVSCGEKQLKFDELRGMIESDKKYVLERDERFPVRCTLQYYKATDNGMVSKDIMNDIVKQLESSQKLADYMGSLVTEYNPNRPSEWVNNDVGILPVQPIMPIPMPMPMPVPVIGDECKEIRKALEMYGGKDWKVYMNKFEEEEVKDSDLVNISMDDLKELIPKIGPRNRFKKWMDSRQ